MQTFLRNASLITHVEWKLIKVSINVSINSFVYTMTTGAYPKPRPVQFSPPFTFFLSFKCFSGM